MLTDRLLKYPAPQNSLRRLITAVAKAFIF